MEQKEAAKSKKNIRELHFRINDLDERIGPLKKEFRRDEREFEKAISRILGTALALAAALLWRDAIMSTINRFLPPEQSWEWELMAAALFTIIASIIILVSSRWSHQSDKG
ncbi:MAG: DUF5654 family protein [Candidatus Micrarchaeota archaeon]